jgi:transposase
MYGVELYSKVRMAVLRDGMSRRGEPWRATGSSAAANARRFGIDRGTVAKMVGHAIPPGYRQAEARVRPKLDAHAGFIDDILKSDPTAPTKQRHTILRIFERLRDERGFDGGYTTVRDYVRPRRLALKEVFVPLTHPAGHAQADFGEGEPSRRHRFEPDGERRCWTASGARCTCWWSICPRATRSS